MSVLDSLALVLIVVGIYTVVALLVGVVAAVVEDELQARSR